jgi:peptidoglycan/xylan/chitin deacetylase (PgdA/CDA1 family)
VHIISLSFDDGFRKSNLRLAEAYERFGLSGCMNVLAAPEELNSKEAADWGADRGDFGLWNELQARGHEIMPHGYRHANKAELPHMEAQDLITRGLDIFAARLDGFEAKRAVFNFPYNQVTPALEAWLPSVVKAYRAHGTMINPLPSPGTVKIGTGGHGPDNCEAHLDAAIAELLARPSGWLVYNTHGLDEEGWGPIGSDYLDRLLARLVEIDSVRVRPTARALNELGG